MNIKLSILLLSFLCLFLSPDIYSQNVEPSHESVAEEKNEADTLNLGEVVVAASTITHKGMTDSYMVTNEMRRRSHIAGDLLSGLSGVFYNPATREVKYLGSTNVIILVDSVPKDPDYIKRLSPQRFDRIDIVNNPTGQYQDYDALINFHTKPDYEGYELESGGQVAFNPTDGNGKGRHFLRGFGGVNLTYTRNRLTFSVSPSFSAVDQNQSTYYSREYLMNNLTEHTIEQPKDRPTNLMESNYLSTGFTLDYKINDSHSLSLLYGIKNDSFEETERQTIERFHEGGIDDRRIIDYSSKYRTKGSLTNDLGIYYRGRFGKWQLNTHITQTFSGYDSRRDVIRSDGYTLHDPRRISRRNFWGGFDLSRSLGENQNWMIGVSNTTGLINYRQKQSGTGVILSDNSLVDNRTQFYTGFNPSGHFSAYVYVGFSAYRNKVQDMSHSYVSPSFTTHLTYRPTGESMIRLSYNHRRNMPALSMLTDYGSFTDSLIYQSGNPALNGAIQNQVALNMIFLNSLNIRLSYEGVRDAIYNISGFSQGEYPYVCYRYENGRKDVWRFGVDYNKWLSRNWQLGISSGLLGLYARYGDIGKHKWLPEGDIQLIYFGLKVSTKIVAAYSLMRELDVTPQMISHGLRDGFSLFAEKYLLKNRLAINLMYFPPLHLVRGNKSSVMNSPALDSRGWSNNQFRSDNCLWAGFRLMLNGGKKVRKFEHKQYDIQEKPDGN